MSRGDAVDLRPVLDSDCEILWQWANDPIARAASFDPRPISWTEHEAWFQARRSDDHGRMYIVEESGRPVGVVRFALEGPGEAVVSINIAPVARGRGLGPEALRRACARIFADGAASSITAFIKRDNPASLRAFEQAGFARIDRDAADDTSAVVMRWTADHVSS